VYQRSAPFYDAINHFVDYAAQARQLRELVGRHAPGARTLLDVCCGTGRHMEPLRAHYEVEGLDINPDLLEIARRRCPGASLHRADMADFDIGHPFDVIVCLFSSIGAAKTLERMQQAIACMERHLCSGGMLVVEPWFSPESYWVGRVTANFTDQPDLKICWMYKTEIEGRVAFSDVHYLVGTPGGVEHFSERQELGLFTDDEYRAAFRQVGLEVEYDPHGLNRRGMYIGLKKAL